MVGSSDKTCLVDYANVIVVFEYFCYSTFNYVDLTS